MNFKYLLKQFLTFGMLDFLNNFNNRISDDIVVADNKPIFTASIPNKILNSRYKTVCGSSMSAFNINDGDKLLVSKVDKISNGDFIIVENDEELYGGNYFNHKFKIYKYIMLVDNSYDAKKIINEIKDNNYDELIWLKRNQKRIMSKYLKARKIYPNDLALCVMYKNGVIDYYFINKKLICYKVISKILE